MLDRAIQIGRQHENGYRCSDRKCTGAGDGVGFMMWIWLSVVIILLGGELNAEMEHQTARDTTDGTPKPLGTRGAMMADHVGAAQD